MSRDRPQVVEFPPGKHAWCACGRSATHPLCDGTHRGSEAKPVKFVLERPTVLAICRCGRTGTPPECDGSHARSR